MNMGIVNPTLLEVYDEIPKPLLEKVEDVLLNRKEDATENLLEYAESIKGTKKKSRKRITPGENKISKKGSHMPW